ncbi:hypothetical protein R55227_BLOPHJLP_00652 [Fructobacillus tropaeoli]|uniref:toll/interleukin-1 receptor domain-containing protein n=1 Tax=Fructobacillus tropaeoli TaxID=709323 RepID=UPI002D87FD17|nr:hypothetical protein R55227_BLOPHJLP_00652 [Fructobacillus tropaeoli]CAK1237618.1 hypothetical protein LMG30237_ALEAABJJ_00669 [Fructobacillus tropaeoli]
MSTNNQVNQIEERKPEIFLSWSGKASNHLASKFQDLLKDILMVPKDKIFISSSNIEPGDDWWKEVSAALKTAKIGIVFVTKDNHLSPWLNYEAGVLQEKFRESFQENFQDDHRVIPVSMKEDFAAVQDNEPLKKFQFITAIDDEKETKKLLLSLQDKLSIELSAEDFERRFKKNWPDFLKAVDYVKNLNLFNFRDMLNFWVPKVENAWAPDQGGKKAYYAVSEIRPQIGYDLADYTSTVEQVVQQDDKFDRRYLELTPEDLIAVKFTNNGQLRSKADSSITWIPDQVGHTWFIKIIYDAGRGALLAKYVADASNTEDIPHFKEFMKKKGYTKGRVFDVKDLDLLSKSDEVSDSVKNLYNYFVEMIQSAKEYRS